jgi:hypothetical protein
MGNTTANSNILETVYNIIFQRNNQYTTIHGHRQNSNISGNYEMIQQMDRTYQTN